MARWNRFVVPPNDALCTECSGGMERASLRCEDCKRFSHIQCTKLPLSQLVHYFSSRIAYYCLECMRKKYNDYDETIKKIKECLDEPEVEDAQSEHSFDNSQTTGSNTPTAPPASQVLTQVENNISTRSAVERQERGDQRLATAQAEPSGGKDCPIMEARVLRGDARKSQASAMNTNNKKNKICAFYKKGDCKFGKKGRECKYMHPPQCLKFQRHGDGTNGCRKGTKCEYFHPHTCRFSADGGHCGDHKCKRLHVRAYEDGAANRSQQELRGGVRRNQSFEYSGQRTGAARVEQNLPWPEPMRPARPELFVGHEPSDSAFLGVKEEVRQLKDQMRRLLELVERRACLGEGRMIPEVKTNAAYPWRQEINPVETVNSQLRY